MMDDNPFAQPESLHQLVWSPVEDEGLLIEAAFEDVALSSTILPDDNGMALTIYHDGLAEDEIARRMAVLRDVHGKQHHFVEPVNMPVEQKDWVSEVQKHFQPMRAGRFYVYGSHHDVPDDGALVTVLMDAGAAFGTGEHGTTSGCLYAMDTLAKERSPQHICDMGCGTAILAIAAAKCWPDAQVMAAEIDPVAVEVAQANVDRNAVSEQCTVICSDGYADERISQYELIIANILAGPLMAMAEDMVQHLTQGGQVILSGILESQADDVIACHEACGLTLQSRKLYDGWAVLVMKKAA